MLVAKSQPAANRDGLVPNGRILVPVDFSDCSVEGLNYAIQFADRFAATIFVLAVVNLGYSYSADGLPMYDFSALEEAARRQAEQDMAGFVRRVNFGGVRFETAIDVGSPVDRICAFAERHQTDLIISSTHGRTGLQHVLMGSTAEQMLRRAQCPVLIVPSHPEIRTARLMQGSASVRRSPSVIPLRTAMKDTLLQKERLTKKARRSSLHPVPERRKTNKFREPHRV